MTRADRLAQQEARAKARLVKHHARHSQIQSAQREEARKRRSKRRYAVGTLADTAGLFVLDDATLAGLFGLLALVTERPDPVAVLAACLSATEGPALASGDGMAEVAGVNR